jgi:hypothetical protein
LIFLELAYQVKSKKEKGKSKRRNKVLFQKLWVNSGAQPIFSRKAGRFAAPAACGGHFSEK